VSFVVVLDFFNPSSSDLDRDLVISSIFLEMSPLDKALAVSDFLSPLVDKILEIASNAKERLFRASSNFLSIN
jgi:hypothetical protein